MEILQTILLIALIVAVLYKKKAPIEEKETPKATMTEEEKQKKEKIKKAFNSLMEYDYKTALAKGDETKGQM